MKLFNRPLVQNLLNKMCNACSKLIMNIDCKLLSYFKKKQKKVFLVYGLDERCIYIFPIVQVVRLISFYMY